MAPTRRRFLGTVTTAGVIGLAGCPDDQGGGDGGPTVTQTETEPSPTATATESGGGSGMDQATVSVDSHAELGNILADGEGRTLYMFDPDTQGADASTCSGDCAEAWPPLTVDGDPNVDDGVTADISTFEREDGTRQVAANGWPLYYFVNDEAPGDANGQGANDVWWVLAPDGTPIRAAATEVAIGTHSKYGDILVDGDGRTLYMFDQDTRGAGQSACPGIEGCDEAWPPLAAESDDAVTAGDNVTAELTTFEREDGTRQVVANGWPLYYFVNDEEPGDANGQGVNDVWWVLGPDGTPKRPATATVAVRSHPDYGEILVDGDGRTLYMFDSDTQGSGASTCSGDCADAWPPLTAAGGPETGEGVTAELGSFERADGSRQITANGWPLYYFVDDEESGDATGQGVNDVWWVLDPAGVPQRPEETPTETAAGGGGGSVY